MSEQLLKALMQLFALASNDYDITSESRVVVERFLNTELSSDQVEQYLNLYEEYFFSYYKDGDNNKVELLGEDFVSEICLEINKNLLQKQKVIVLLRLLEYIYADGNMSSHELEFVNQLSNVFNIPHDELFEALKFTSATSKELEHTTNMLLVSDHEENFSLGRVLFREHLDGHIVFINIRSVGMFAFRYFGETSLYLNGQSIIPGRVYIFNQGSSLRSSKVDPVYYSDVISSYMDTDDEKHVCFEVTEITYEFKNGNKGLHEFSFAEEGGKLIGIMGGSGSGKSTLLNVLNGNYTPASGVVTINGLDIHKEKERIKGVIGYISQDDLLMEDLTVYQNLFYNAKLCFANESELSIKKRVLDLLETLGLSDAKELKVGNPIEKVISGGQRKRLNIALELIREPSVLFVDEPTSGLSSRDSENIMDLLKQLSLKGKMIFVVIHQPSSDIFKMFDRLCLLDLGGRPIYYGDPVDSIMYFKEKANQVNSQESECGTCGNVNPEQIFNIIERKVVDEYGNPTGKRKVLPADWHRIYTEENIHTNDVRAKHQDPPKNILKTPGVIGQFLIFVKRDVLSKLANSQYMLINMLEAPVLAILLSYFVKFSSTEGEGYMLFGNDNLPAYIFMSVVVALFVGLTVSAEEIIRDRKIRKRESFLNLSKGSYLWSKIFILFTISAIQTITFVLLGNAIMEIEGLTFSYWFILFSTSCMANMLGLNISSAFNSEVTIYILIPFLIIPQLIFSGVIVKFDKLNPSVSSVAHVPAIGEIMASRWAFEALAVAQFRDNELNKEIYPYDKQLSIIQFRKVYWLPEVESYLNTIEGELLKTEDRDRLVKNFALVRNELGSPSEKLGYPAYDFTIDLADTDSDENYEAIKNARKFLDKVKKHLNKNYMHVLDAKDERIAEIDYRSSADDHFNHLKKKHTNQSLEDLVTKRADFPKILEHNGKLIQREDPVYHDASHFRAHFFAPQKLFMGKYYDTYDYNAVVIWLMSFVLGVTLYFGLFRKFIDLFSKPGR